MRDAAQSSHGNYILHFLAIANEVSIRHYALKKLPLHSHVVSLHLYQCGYSTMLSMDYITLNTQIQKSTFTTKS